MEDDIFSLVARGVIAVPVAREHYIAQRDSGESAHNYFNKRGFIRKDGMAEFDWLKEWVDENHSIPTVADLMKHSRGRADPKRVKDILDALEFVSRLPARSIEDRHHLQARELFRLAKSPLGLGLGVDDEEGLRAKMKAVAREMERAAWNALHGDDEALSPVTDAEVQFMLEGEEGR